MKHVAVGVSVLTLAGVGFVTTPEARAQTAERRFDIRTLVGGAGSRIGIGVRDTEANEFDAAGLERPGGVVIETVTDDSPAALEGLSTDPNDPVYVMWKDTPYAHIMVKIAEEQ